MQANGPQRVVVRARLKRPRTGDAGSAVRGEKRSKRAATTDREAVRSAALSKVAAKKRYVKAGLDDKRKAKAARRSGGGGGGGDGDD